MRYPFSTIIVSRQANCSYLAVEGILLIVLRFLNVIYETRKSTFLGVSQQPSTCYHESIGNRRNQIEIYDN